MDSQILSINTLIFNFQLILTSFFTTFNMEIQLSSFASSSFLLIILGLVGCLFEPTTGRHGRVHGGIATYWGQNIREGRLTTACATGKFQIVNIGFLSTFGDGQPPQVNLTRHCNPICNGCWNVSAGIVNCQNDGVKVMLSIGGPHGNYSLSSAAEALDLADYIWNNFLYGHSTSPRPFGYAPVDGVDFRCVSIKNPHILFKLICMYYRFYCLLAQSMFVSNFQK